MSTPTQITDAAREAVTLELIAKANPETYKETQRGHFVQQLLDAEREKWEKQKQDEDWTASLCDRVNEFLREHRVYDEVKNGEQCSVAITYLHGHAGSLRADRDRLRQQLTEAQAAIAVKDEALKEVENLLQQDFIPDVPFTRKKVEQALSPNCGQPLMELVREMRKRIRHDSDCAMFTGFSDPKCSCGLDDLLTKAAQLGF